MMKNFSLTLISSALFIGLSAQEDSSLAALKEAAQKGDVQAQIACGIELRNLRTQDNDAEALAYFISAAKAGQNDAQYHAGCMLARGQGTENNRPDTEQAMSFLTEAANAGLADAQYQLALMLKNTDAEKACSYFKMAAAQGHILAQEELKEVPATTETTCCQDVIA
jgi:hypothetical protein